MRKKLLSFAAVILTSGVLVFTGCKKDDATPPVVTLNGAESVTVILNSTYTELGATATDDKDGAITPVASGSVNTDLVGTYTITYSATDAAGNEGTATRTVIVRNEADIYAGEYTTTNDTVWTQTVTASPTKNKAIVFSMFACLSKNSKITAVLVGGTAFQLDGPQQAVNVGKFGCTFNFTSLGAGQTIVKSTTNGKYSFSIKYTQARVQGGTSCPASGAASYEDLFVQK